MANFWGPFTQQPNILILMTDQQRTTQHYPSGWEAANLPNLTALKQSGITFNNAMTNTTACSPSRSVLFTSTYPTLNGVTSVGGTLKINQNIRLPDDSLLPLATLGQIMQDSQILPSNVNYQVAYKGKWHLDGSYQSGLSAAEQQADQDTLTSDDQDMQNTYGFPGWTSPDFGTAMSMGAGPVPQSAYYTLGAGIGQNDVRVTNGTSYPDSGTTSVSNAVDFLSNYSPNGDGSNPFLLTVSLLNPHDVWVSPYHYDAAGFKKDSDGLYPWQKVPFTDITLPDTYQLTDDQINGKPSIQSTFRTGYSDDQSLDYVRFYAYLETLTDALLGDVVSALNSNPNNLGTNTLIIRLADHGEMAMAQAGMVEKEHEVYNETLQIPMIFAHPDLAQGASNDSLVGMLDVIPTIAEMSGIDVSLLKSTYAIQGNSLSNLLLDPNTSTDNDQLLFATDDDGAHIRCLIDNGAYLAKYAVYYDFSNSGDNNNGSASNFQYEMYDYSQDPSHRNSEASNLLPLAGYGTGTITAQIQTLWHHMHNELTLKAADFGQLPDNWPAAPPLPNH